MFRSKNKPGNIIVIENVRKCSLCGQDVQLTADKEPFCQKCGWIELDEKIENYA